MEGVKLTDENGKPVVPIESGDPYSWVKGEVREQVSLFQDDESVVELGDPVVWVRKGEKSTEVCTYADSSKNAWAFIRGFEVLMEFLGQEPLLEVFFSFFQAKGVRKGGLLMLNSVFERAVVVEQIVKVGEGDGFCVRVLR
ncbi:hypothetical protein PIB30_082750 [Stylosanthes scabra]|uniref:Uncharacterized protein n=1 Tax=Stylosanthes scabra TaxID=79078 RepID=A0ABU6QRM0_9FABA|nr:hypothetical protein [Stylosanthes scabra]